MRKAYHGRIADKLETDLKGSAKPPVSDLAYHYSQAGNNEKAVKYSLAAGEDALALFCGTEAIKHFKFVLDAIAETKSTSVIGQSLWRVLAMVFLPTANLEKP